MAIATLSNTNAIQKYLYPEGIAFSGWKKSKFFQLIRKKVGPFGEGENVVVDVAPTGGQSADFAEAQANQRKSTTVRFTLTPKQEYGIASITGPALRNAKGKGAIMSIFDHEFGKAGYKYGRAIASGLWGNAGGSIGQSTTVAAGSITMTLKSEMLGVDIGDIIQLASDNGTGTSPAGVRDGTGEVTAINPENKTITVDTTGITGATSGDYVFVAGNYANKFTGLLGWHPLSAPGSDAFFGVDRTATNVQRLSGVYHSGNGARKDETMIDACALADFYNLDCTHLFANPLDLKGLRKELMSGHQVDIAPAKKSRMGVVGFKGVEIDTPTGPVTVVSEPDCPKGYAKLINPKNYCLRSSVELPSFLNEDINGKLRMSPNADSYDFRLGADLQLRCDNPADCINITW